MNLKNFKFLLIPLFCLALLLIAQGVSAQSILPACTATGRCTLCDVLQVVINFGKFLLGIVGSLALLMFVYGGFMWLSSGGESAKIDAGKKILTNSVIGICITFFAWVVVSFVVSTLTQSTGWNWNQQLTCAPLPTLPPAVVTDRWPAGSQTQGSKKEGETCAHTNECDITLYCDKASTKCTKKIATANPPTAQPSDKKCVGMEIEGKDDMACIDGKCCTTSIGGMLCGPKDYCTINAGSGGGKECTATKKCNTGLYCAIVAADPTGKTGTCQNKLEFGKPCKGNMIVGGKAEEVCASDNCTEGICMPGPGQIVNESQACVDTKQCKNPCSVGIGGWPIKCEPTQLWCYGAKSSDRGICKKGPLIDGQPCDNVAKTFAVPGDVNGPCNLPGSECTGGICKVKQN